MPVHDLTSGNIYKKYSQTLGIGGIDFLRLNAHFDEKNFLAHLLIMNLSKLYSKAVAKYPARHYMQNLHMHVSQVGRIMEFLDTKIPTLPERKEKVPQYLFELDSIITDFLSHLPDTTLELIKVGDCHKLGRNEVPEDTLIDRIADILSFSDKTIDLAFYHGSYATRDFIPGGSDLDLVVYLSSEAFSSEENFWYISRTLNTVNNCLKKIDILSHHGIFVRPPCIKDYFIAGLEPKVLFDYGLSLVGRHLKCRVVDYPFYRFLVLFQQVCVHERYRTTIKNDNTALHWKNLVADALLLPCVVLQIVGNFMYKRSSFPKFYERYADLDVDVIHNAEKYRKKWGSQKNLYRLNKKVRNPWAEKIKIRLALEVANHMFPIPSVSERLTFNERLISLYREIIKMEDWLS